MRPESTSLWKERQGAAYLALHAEISAVLFRHDPVGVNFESNTDEYETEAQWILVRPSEASGAVDVRRTAGEVFDHWFTGVRPNTGSLNAAADEIWGIWTSSPMRTTVTSYGN